MTRSIRLDRQCRQCFAQAVERISAHHQLPAERLEKLLADVRRAVDETGEHNVPPRAARKVMKLIAKAVDDDPFREIKAAANQKASEAFAQLRERIAASADPFSTAVRVALAGNVVDFAYNGSHDLPAAVERMIRQPLGVNDTEMLREELAAAKNVLVLGDNVGETWCDRLLIEQFPSQAQVTYAVRSAPVLNDATLADARIAGLPEVAEVISSGSDAPGTLLDLITDEMRERFAQADVVVSKGQGNFEALYGVAERPLFFLFLVKCAHVEKVIGHPIGTGVIWRWRGN